MKKIAFILGTRPEVIKLFPLILECERIGQTYFIIHTNQHYDENMDAIFFKDLNIPLPKYNLGVGSASHGKQIGQMLIKIEEVIIAEKPDIVVVQGDTNSVLAGSLIATRYGISVAHVEAGLRSYDRTMPEEINRITADTISDYLFCPTTKQQEILLSEGINPEKIHVTGNTIVDAVLRNIELAEVNSNILSELELITDKYFLLTCHRPDNTDNEKNFKEIISAISEIANDKGFKCVFPMHPRLKKYTEYVKSFNNILIIPPTNYFESLVLQKNSGMIFTDSGGIQEEACILKKKSVILRLNTERPETVAVGGAILLDDITSKDIKMKFELLSKREVSWSNPFGDGKASDKILKIIS